MFKFIEFIISKNRRHIIHEHFKLRSAVVKYESFESCERIISYQLNFSVVKLLLNAGRVRMAVSTLEKYLPHHGDDLELSLLLGKESH